MLLFARFREIPERLRNKSRIDHQFPQACSGIIAHSRSFQAAVCGALPISALLHARDLRSNSGPPGDQQSLSKTYRSNGPEAFSASVVTCAE
jgi:hypothetical protein